MTGRNALPTLFLILTLLPAAADKGTNIALEAVSLETRLSGAIYGENDQQASEWDMTFMPTLHFRSQNSLETAPYLLVRYENETDSEDIQNSNPAIATDLSRLSLGMGCGFYWYFVQSSYINLISGFRPEIRVEFPQWGESSPTGYYYDPGIGACIASVAIPIGLEFGPWGRLRFRLWMEPLRFNGRWDEEYYRDDIIDRTISFFAESPFWNGQTQSLSFSVIINMNSQ